MPRLVLVVTSDTAFLEVDGIPCAIRALRGLQHQWPSSPIVVCAGQINSKSALALLHDFEITHDFIMCDVLSPQSLAKTVSRFTDSCSAIVFHDASRPLINPEECQMLLEAFGEDVDAVRPAIAFTETLKFVNENRVIEETLDRNSVKRISTPEIIRTSAIDFGGKDSGWLVALKDGARTRQIEGDPAGLRLNSMADRDLFESYLHWSDLN